MKDKLVETTKKTKPHFSFISIWYPLPELPQRGIFIRRHALSLIPYSKVSVIVPVSRKGQLKTYEIFTEKTAEGLLEILVFYKKSTVPALSLFANAFRLIRATLKGLLQAEKELGQTDMIVFQNLCRTPLLVLIGFLKQKKFALFEHYSGWITGNFRFTDKLFMPLYKLATKKACAVLVVSKFLQQKMESFGIAANYLVVPNIVPISSAPANKEQSETKTILYVGAFREWIKNTSLLIRAASELKKKRSDFKVVLVGGGEDEEKLKKLVKELQLDDVVEFKGVLPPDKMAELYAVADVVVVTSKVETFSVVAAEAMGSGVPVITTKCGGPEEFISKNEGIVLDGYEPNELAEALESILSGRISFDRKKIIKKAAQLFSAEQVGKELFKILSSCLIQ
jgi:glycosyltransferase involved in cell wall biosynthesis